MSGSSKHRVVVGLSGGVDSAVSAWLLKQAGHEVVGVFMQNWTDDDVAADAAIEGDTGYCTSREDFLDAASVADVLGIEIEHVNFAAEYKDRVFAEFLREYQAGRTPNPDVLCNAEIKFKAFLDHALRLGADRIATGHYARVRRLDAAGRVVAGDAGVGSHSSDDSSADGNGDGGTVQLLRGLDANKDQSYFLHRLTQAQLARVWFPVGELPKPEVRRIAAEIGLPVATKRDSTGICFIGERPFREFLNRYVANRPGVVEDDRGRVVGEHVGLSFYTLGQRKGIGIGGVKGRGGARGGSDHAPWFVARKELARNVLVVVQGHDHPWLLSSALRADDVSWVAGHAPAALSIGLGAKTRYRQRDAACRWTDADAGDTGHTGDKRDEPCTGATGQGFIDVVFDEPQWAVTPGQSVVFYDGEVCLGGAVIDSSTPAESSNPSSAPSTSSASPTSSSSPTSTPSPASMRDTRPAALLQRIARTA